MLQNDRHVSRWLQPISSIGFNLTCVRSCILMDVDLLVGALFVCVFKVVFSMFQNSFSNICLVSQDRLRFNLICLFFILGEYLFQEELLWKSETFHRLGTSSNVDELAPLVTTDIVIADESTFVNVDSHLDSILSLRKSLRVHIVSDAHRSFLNKVHKFYIVLFIVNERWRIVITFIKEEGLESKWHIVKEFWIFFLFLGVEKQTEAVKNVVK